MPPIFTEVPKTTESWANAVSLSGNTIHPNQRDQWGSGSNISEEEYLLLRVLWSFEEQLDAEMRSKFGLNGRFKTARRWLGKFEPFAKYLEQVESGSQIPKYDPQQLNPDAWGSGIFDIAAHEQYRIVTTIASSTTTTGSRKPLDEQTINAALMAFLTSIAMKHSLTSEEESQHRLRCLNEPSSTPPTSTSQSPGGL
ncbi:uncharacterized protein N7515_010073 [Penicillium bovifimosum]|uniref:Uncharacterized protein n=1 Tax=Penicillium bovifimosum TaxID=126998 RepID=A0A9W9GI73_9EURO|nr:uncharacterized protein N7515_010073 [Penicillium bovifimosum]KAJ5120685.1 hypothetical protein N7515_010073 [Penicillium bovifimosum]